MADRASACARTAAVLRSIPRSGTSTGPRISKGCAAIRLSRASSSRRTRQEACQSRPSSARLKIVRAARLSNGTGLPPAVGSFGAISHDHVELGVVDIRGPRACAARRSPRAARSTQSMKRMEARLQPDIGREPLDLVLDGGAVEHEHVGHEHAVGQPVMGVVERADRMRQRVDGAEPLLERGRAHRRRRHHVRARFEVVAVLHGRRQVFLDQPHALDRDAVGERVIERRAIGLEAMRERVHAGAGGDHAAACRRSAPDRRSSPSASSADGR